MTKSEPGSSRGLRTLGGNTAHYISVSLSRNGSPVEAEGEGTASVNGFHAELSVTLDLRNLREGTYYLGTTHEGDQASYYYPLTLR